MTIEINKEQLGLLNSTSRKWWVSYNGSASVSAGLLAGGVYEFIFRGDDSLTGAVVQLIAGGPAYGFGVSKLGKARMGGVGKSQKMRSSGGKGSEVTQLGEDIVNLKDSVGDHVDLTESPSPWCDMKNVSLKSARRAFSLNDLDSAWGGIEFAVDTNGLVAGASVLSINASLSVISTYSEADENTLFEGWRIYNLDDGSIGVSVYSVQGKWSVLRWDDLTTHKCPIKSGPGLEHFYSSNPNLQALD